jgi:hypothetical protein
MLRRWIWRDFANILLGFWLIASPSILGYRDAAMIWSDVVAGTVIVLLGVLTLSPRFDLALWGLCFTGIWLLCAPLVFWTRDAGAYANDTMGQRHDGWGTRDRVLDTHSDDAEPRAPPR